MNPCWFAIALLAVSGGTASAAAWVAGEILTPSYRSSRPPSNLQVVFPTTSVGDSTRAVIALVTHGDSSGTLNHVIETRDSFQPNGVPTLSARRNATEPLTVVLADRTVGFNLSATSSGSFTYTTGAGSPVFPGQTITLADTPIGQTTTLKIQVANSGSGNGTITGIAVSGQGFQLSNLPIMPLTLPPLGTADFNVNFNASQPGVSTGFLQIGSDVFKLAANATGAKLVYSYVQGSTPVTLQGSGDTVVTGSVQIGQTSNIPFTITNQGNVPATVSTIGLSSAKSAYSLTNLPALPATIAPGGQLSFTIVLSPTVLGDNTAQLRVDAVTFSLVGSGTPPPALPRVTITGPGQVVGPMQQPTVSLSLASPYTLPLVGTLTMTVSSNNFVVDPAVQFATGGRSVTFNIPANTTQAQFSTGDSVPLQTGTVAASISVGASIATATGVDVTPASPPSISFAVPDGPPQVLGVQVGPQTANSLTVTVTGFSTTRSLTQLTLDFTPTASYQIPGSHYVFDISASAGLWYSSVESQAYGSQFAASIPFTFQGSDPSATLGQVFQSITATLSNAIGQSNSASFTLQP